MMEKIVENGMVAVAVSEGYGAGWSTWNDVDPTDARFNKLFIAGQHGDAMKLCDQLGLGYSNGGRNVNIEWVPVGTEFVIDEYDGFESIQTKDSFSWNVA